MTKELKQEIILKLTKELNELETLAYESNDEFYSDQMYEQAEKLEKAILTIRELPE